MAGSKLGKSDVCSALSLTLPASLDPLMTALKNFLEDELTYELMKTRLLSEGSKRMERMHSFEEKLKKKFTGKCHVCGKKGHMKRDWRMNKGDVNAASGSKTVVFMAESGSAQQESYRKLQLPLDSGASEHLVNSKKQFPKHGESLVAKKSGVIKGLSNRGVIVEARDVLFVLSLRKNLMSVEKLTIAGVEVLCSMERLQPWRGYCTGHPRGKLYDLKLEVHRVSAMMGDPFGRVRTNRTNVLGR